MAGQVDDGSDEYPYSHGRSRGASIVNLGIGSRPDFSSQGSRGSISDMGHAGALAGLPVEHRLRQLEQAVESLQAELQSRPPQSLAMTSFGSNQHSNPQCDVHWDSSARVYFVEIHKPTSIPYCDALYTLQAESCPYPSVINRGIFTAEQVDMAFHTFKHAVSPICPLSIWQSMSTPTPTHAFVILAMLHHVPAFAKHPALADMVDESLSLVLRAQMDEAVVLALLILSLAPPPNSADAPARPRPTPLRLISLAHDIGKGLGMASEVKRIVRQSDNLGWPEWSRSLEQIELVSLP